jgi:hypothetical protein
MHRLFAFADCRDAAMMTVGALAAVVNGLAMPFLTFLIGDLVDSFGSADRTRVVHVVSKVWSPRPRASISPSPLRRFPVSSLDGLVRRH